MSKLNSEQTVILDGLLNKLYTTLARLNTIRADHPAIEVIYDEVRDAHITLSEFVDDESGS